MRNNLNKDEFDSINLFFQDESRYGLKTFIGYCLAAVGIRPIVNYQHKFTNTYLWGSYSPINGDSFVWEINGVDSNIFEAYLNEFSKQNPREYKIVVIDNAGFHATKNIEIPENIYLLRIPPYTPELNPCEQVWQYIKQRFKNQTFENIDQLKKWLHNMVTDMDKDLIKSIVSNHRYLEIFEKIILS
ncbi:IS630 family transposase [Tenacibaculum sp. M341]|nr:IS630 family transposase [Tenacibaculum sp. M341]